MLDAQDGILLGISWHLKEKQPLLQLPRGYLKGVPIMIKPKSEHCKRKEPWKCILMYNQVDLLEKVLAMLLHEQIQSYEQSNTFHIKVQNFKIDLDGE